MSPTRPTMIAAVKWPIPLMSAPVVAEAVITAAVAELKSFPFSPS
jgi:hypothetical protein